MIDSKRFDWNGVGYTTWGAAQASISVLCVMGYGYAACFYQFLNKQGIKSLSTITTTIFLPALFFSEIGPEATISRFVKYWPIIVFALFNIFVSYVYGTIGYRIFKSKFPFPRWIIPSCMYNNVITLPMLMLESLAKAGALDGIITDPSAMAAALRRAKTYCLLNALVYNLLKFRIGPQMMIDAEPSPANSPGGHERSDEDEDPERIPLIQSTPVHNTVSRSIWEQLREKLNPPLIGGILAVVVGLIPFLRGMFLEKNGIFKGSVTQSINNMGSVYAPVQILIVGAQLYGGTQRATKKKLPKLAMFFLLGFRFLFMPILSLSIIYGIRQWKPHLFMQDPMFDFALMIAPIGPPAITIAAIAEIANVSEEDTGLIARMLTVSYIVTPLISFPVAAALILIKGEHIVYTPS